MGIDQQSLSKMFNDFFASEKSSGILVLVCTAIALLLTNSSIGENYLSLWQRHVGGLSIEHWINDALMAIFFHSSAWNSSANFTAVNSQTSGMRFFRFSLPSAELSHLP